MTLRKWLLLLAPVLLTGAIALTARPGTADGETQTVYLPILSDQRIDLSVPRVERTILLPDALCPNVVAYNRVSDTWYVGDHYKYNVGLYDEHDGQVTVLRNHEVIATVMVGGRPTAIAPDPRSGLTYVTSLPAPYPPNRPALNRPADRRPCGDPAAPGFDPACVNVFDGPALLKQWDPLYEPFAALVNPADSTLYVTDLDSAYYTGYGTTTFDLHELRVDPEPGQAGWTISMDADPASGLVYIPSWEKGNLFVVRGAQVVASYPVDGWGPHDIALDYRRGLLYLANSETHVPGRPTNNITVMRTDTFASTALFSGSAALFVEVHQASGYAYVVNQDDGTVSVLRNGEWVRNIAVGAKPGRLAINQLTGYVYVTLMDDDQVAVLRNGQLIAKLPTDPLPYDVWADETTGYAYVINRNSETRYDGLNRPYEYCRPNPSITVLR